MILPAGPKWADEAASAGVCPGYNTRRASSVEAKLVLGSVMTEESSVLYVFGLFLA